MTNRASLLNGKFDCACGRDHTCDIHALEIGSGALRKLPDICRHFSNILLVADGNTYPLCGDEIKALLNKKITSEQIFGKEIVVPNEEAIAKIESAFTPNTDLLLGIGSGVINDLCKHVSFKHGLRYAIVATAPSMDGYASVGAALILEEMKVTLNARVPYAIVADGDILRTAPIDMIRAGYGDIIGKYSCLNDWKLAKLLRGEYFCDYVWQTVLDTVKETEANAQALLRREPQAVAQLTEALVCVGIMMSYVGNSRPASGSEHHLSHFFEITGLLHGRDYYPHGIDVLYSAAVTARLREKLIALPLPLSSKAETARSREDALRRIYTTAADGIIALQEKVGLYRELDISLFAEHWEEIKAILSEAPTYEQMLTYLSDIGLDINEFHYFYGKDVLDDSVKYAKDLKDRYTVLWLCYALGISYDKN